MNDKRKILYVSNAYKMDTNRLKAWSALQKLSTDIVALFAFNKKYKRTFWDKLLTAIKLPTDPCKLNTTLLELQKQINPDFVFIVKGVNIKVSTLKTLKMNGAKIVSWSNDDMYGWHNRSLYYTWGLKHYDLVVTQKSYNCNPDELPSLGAKNILFQDKAFDKTMHYPVECSKFEYKYNVVFVGTYENERLESLKYLADNGITVNIFGWSKQMPSDFHKNLVFHNKHLYGDDYAAIFCCSKISLNFLRRLNRDLQTSRSVEIPACKGFMLAERTNEHQRLFKEGKEAEFFNSNKEMLRKTRYYLEHEDERKKIAAAGYQRCIDDDYSFDNRMKEIIEKIYPQKL